MDGKGRRRDEQWMGRVDEGSKVVMKVRTTKDEESLNRSRRMEKKMNNWVSFFVSAGFRNLIVNLGV